MKKNMCFLLFLMLVRFAYAENVPLKSGVMKRGEIVARTDKDLSLKDEQGHIVAIPLKMIAQDFLNTLQNIPHLNIPLDTSAVDSTGEKVAEVSAKFASIQGFSCDYKFRKIPLGVTTASPLSEIPFEESVKGVLKYQDPNRLSLRYVFGQAGGKSSTENFIITDGITLWHHRNEAHRPDGGVVIQESLAARTARFNAMAAGVKKMKAYIEEFQVSDGKDVLARNQQTFYEAGMLEMLPDFIKGTGIKLFDGVDRESISFEVKEELEGEEVYKFNVKAKDAQRKAIHWIGVRDGIPRKIVAFNPDNNEIDREILLQNVRPSETFAVSEFQFDISQSKLSVMNRDNPFVDGNEVDKSHLKKGNSALLKVFENPAGNMNAMKEMMDSPPEKTFIAFFSNPLTDIRALKGSGTSLAGYDLFVHFTTEKELIIKDIDSYVSRYPQKEREWFQKTFPEMAEDLQDIEKLICLIYEGKEDSRVLLFNQAKKTYFFRAWGANRD